MWICLKKIFIVLILFGQFGCSFLSNKNENKILHEFISKTEMPNFETAVICNERNAVYAEYDGILYELKFSDITDFADFGFGHIEAAGSSSFTI